MLNDPSCGLMFFGVPHAGGNDALVKLGNIATGIINLVSGSPRNDKMEAVTNGSIYSEILTEHFKHRLGEQLIISFYERDEKVTLISMFNCNG